MIRAGLISIALILAYSISAQGQLVVHEWGTFTSLQDETGRSIGGINTDDEPVPGFVHRAANLIQAGDDTGKGIPANDSEVTMRLETPVMYFHLPAGATSQTVDVNVAFRGGWLTEYFPDAEAYEPELTSARIGHLEAETVSSLTWRGVRIGEAGDGPKTSDPVWTSPREVRCDSVVVGGEAEKFLFYRGVGRLDSPVRVERNPNDNRLTLWERSPIGNSTTGQFWLVDVRDDGGLAYRTLKSNPAISSNYLAATKSEFAVSDFGDGSSLRKEMSDALVAQGLFRDEADALLTTWRQSYFQNAGLRLFFLVDPGWTNRVLPLRISGGATITRVMVGRIELVTPGERELIGRIAGQSTFDPEIPLKEACPAYEALGRFRNALLLDQLSRHPNLVLRQILQGYGVRAFTPSGN